MLNLSHFAPAELLLEGVSKAARSRSALSPFVLRRARQLHSMSYNGERVVFNRLAPLVVFHCLASRLLLCSMVDLSDAIREPISRSVQDRCW